MKISSTSERLKQIMSQQGLRQVDILNKCKPFSENANIRIGRNDLSQYVSGKVEPGQEKLAILAKALNVSESWLMGYEVEKDRFTSSAVRESPSPYLTSTEIYDLAAHGVGYGEKLTDEQRDEVKMAIEIALSRYKKNK